MSNCPLINEPLQNVYSADWYQVFTTDFIPVGIPTFDSVGIIIN